MDQAENNIAERTESHPSCMGRRTYSASGRRWTGAFLLLIGTAALLKSYFIPTLPAWLFTWQMLLIILGFFIGIRHNFRGGAWFTLILLGGVFLLNEFYPNIIERRYIWPLALIALGLFLIVKPRRRHWGFQQKEDTGTSQLSQSAIQLNEHPSSDEDILDSTTIFGGIKKTLFTKHFKGGEIVNILGGTEINLSQADINGRVELEVTQIFGGTKLIVPPHWEIKPEMAAIFGGIDDKRSFQNAAIDHQKVLILKGTSVFGGIEIKTF